MCRDLAPILGDVLRKRRCPEVLVDYSCGHSCQPEVHLPAFLADKKDARMASRALRLAVKSGAVPPGEEGVVRIEVPGGPCPNTACSNPGRRRALRCGGVSMDLLSACEAPENAIPVGIVAAQFASWVQQSSSETVQSIPLTSCKGASTWKQFFTTPGSLGPILVAMMLWAVGCFLYAVYATPQIPMVAPEIFYQQVQEQIENIPVPKDSPHYSHYRRYYLEQYREHLAQYREHEEAFRLNKGPRVHWGALLQGLGIGTWIFVAVLAFCEYRYTTVTVSMEMVEERWAAWRQRWKDEAGRGKKKPQRRKEKELKEASCVDHPSCEKEKPRKALPVAERAKNSEEAEALRRAEAEVPKQARAWSWLGFRMKAEEPGPKPEFANTEPGPVAVSQPEAKAAKGEEEPAGEPEPVEADCDADRAEANTSEDSEDSEAEQAEHEQPPTHAASPTLKVDEAKVEGDAPGSDDGSWQMVTKGRIKAKEKRDEAEKPSTQVVEESVHFPAQTQAGHHQDKDILHAPVWPDTEDEFQERPTKSKTKQLRDLPPDEVQVPENPERLSTQALVDFLQNGSIRRKLLRRGVPIREQLVRWFRELQDPPKSLAAPAPRAKQSASASASGGRRDSLPKATPAPWSKLAKKSEEKRSMRAEAPEFFPKDMESMPAGTVLVPCVLPPGQDGSLAVPAGHILLIGAMGLPEGVPLIVPTSETSWEQLNTQFDLVPPFEFACADESDVILDASKMNFLEVPAEDHVAAAIAAAAAAAEAEEAED